MNPGRQPVAESFAVVVARLRPTLDSWGFVFEPGDINSSHCGPYCTGRFVRETTQISISCRQTIDNLFYEHTFVTHNACSTEMERYSIGHETLMMHSVIPMTVN